MTASALFSGPALPVRIPALPIAVIWRWLFGTWARRMRRCSRSAEAVELAREIGQPFTLAFALEHRAWLCNQCRLGTEAQAAAEEEITIATEQGFAYWLASATLFRADSMVLQGQRQEALPLILKGISRTFAQPAPAWISPFTSAFSRCIHASRPVRGRGAGAE